MGNAAVGRNGTVTVAFIVFVAVDVFIFVIVHTVVNYF